MHFLPRSRAFVTPFVNFKTRVCHAKGRRASYLVNTLFVVYKSAEFEMWTHRQVSGLVPYTLKYPTNTWSSKMGKRENGFFFI